MLKYEVEVFTGDRWHAKTSYDVYIKLIGTKNSSDLQKLGPFLDTAPKSFSVPCKESLGTLLFVEVELRTNGWHLFEDKWLCNKMLVTSPEGDKLLFPCYQWLSLKEKIVLRDATAKLIQNETETAAQEYRINILKKMCEAFKWSVYDPEIPHIVHADTFCSLPPEFQFSFSKGKEFIFTLSQALIKLELCHFFDHTKTWNNMEQLKHLGTMPSNVHDYIMNHWKNDDLFGYQFLNGLNPMMIKRCQTLPENFPVTNDMVKSSLPKTSSLEKEMEVGNIFLCDYVRLDQIDGNVIDEKKQYLTAPLCLLFSRPDGKLMPIAIQLKQKPGPDNPIFLPTDSESDWLLAKTFVRGAEFQEHELNFHLLRTHLLAEVFTMATLRTLPPVHPLFKLLMPHTRYTIHINILARNLLVSANGMFAKYTAIGHESVATFLRRASATLTYSSLCLPDNIADRGLEEIPNYYYRDDGMQLWKILHKYVHGVLAHYYTDTDVKNDTELQAWLTEILEHGFPKNDKSGIPKSFQTVMELVKFVTMIIFTVAVQHSAVNNGQYDYGAWMPNFPSTLNIPPPSTKGQTTADSILAALPDVQSTIHTIAFLFLLSKKPEDYYPLGYFPEEYFSEAVPLQMMEEFRNELKALESEIEERNKKLELPYICLIPKDISNSVDL